MNKREAGISYVEVMIAVAMIAVALVPAIDALETGLRAGRIQGERVEDHYEVKGLLEEVLAETFEDLDAVALTAGSATTPSSFSDPVGADPRRLVYLARYDADNADADSNPMTGGDDGLLWIRVELENGGASVETLTRR